MKYMVIMVTRKWENVCVYCQITSISYAVTFVCPPAPCSLHPTHSTPPSFRTFPVVFGIHWFRKSIWRRRWNVQNKHRTLFSDDASGIIQNVLFIFFYLCRLNSSILLILPPLIQSGYSIQPLRFMGTQKCRRKSPRWQQFLPKTRESVDFFHGFSSSSYV